MPKPRSTKRLIFLAIIAVIILAILLVARRSEAPGGPSTVETPQATDEVGQIEQELLGLPLEGLDAELQDIERELIP